MYAKETTGGCRSSFKEHTASVNEVVMLDGDLVASVGVDSMLLSWRAVTRKPVGRWMHSNYLTSLVKLSNDKVMVCDISGRLFVLKHNSGSSLAVHQRLENSHSGSVRGFVVHRNLIVTCSKDKTALLWDRTSFSLLTTRRYSNSVNSAAVSEKHIVAVCDDGNAYVYQNTNAYSLEFVLLVSKNRLCTVAHFNEDIIAVGGLDSYITFIYLPTKSNLSKTEVGHEVKSLIVMNDGRIALTGYRDCYIISPPESMFDAVLKYVATLYGDDRKIELVTGNIDVSSAGSLTAARSPNEIREELKLWKEKGVSKDSMRELGSKEFAACLAEYILNYENDHVETFSQVKRSLGRDLRIYGETKLPVRTKRRRKCYLVF